MVIIQMTGKIRGLWVGLILCNAIVSSSAGSGAEDFHWDENEWSLGIELVVGRFG